MLGVEGITNGEVQPEEAFRVGQTVKVKVLSCTPGEQKMLLSLDMNAKEGTGGPDPNKEKGVGICHAMIGTTVSGTVLSKTEDAVEFKLEGEDSIMGQLRVEHLSDHDELVDELIDNYDVGQTVDNMLVLQASDSKKQVALTLKPSLVKAASTDSLPSEIENVSVGDILNGYVSNVRTRSNLSRGTVLGSERLLALADHQLRCVCQLYGISLRPGAPQQRC